MNKMLFSICKCNKILNILIMQIQIKLQLGYTIGALHNTNNEPVLGMLSLAVPF